MTASARRKYNPGFLSDDELSASFCIRKSEFESIVEMLRTCTGQSNPHQIVIGPRGSGKTSLLLRVAAEVRQDADLARELFPIVFAEESYEVGTAGEFWLECLAHLADQAPHREGAPDLHRALEDLRTIGDDRALEERCLASVLDFSDRESKRLVVLVENLNMMFRDITDRDAGWRLRKTFQTEPRIVLLASAASRFAEIDRPDHAMYDLFRTVTLRPLDINECAVLWEAVSGQSRPPETIRSLQILTGGSPRLIATVARFGAGFSFRELMDNLLDLVDDHTEYFKSHLELLPPQERRVYLALADLWKPALTKEIAARARLPTSMCSAQLARLIERGGVLVAGGSTRRKLYYLSERLYNIYYLLRRNRRPNRLIEALIQFMASYYSPDELRNIGSRIIREARDMVPEMQSLHELAYSKLMELPILATQHTTAQVVYSTEGEREQAMAAGTLFQRGVALSEQNRMEDALAAFDELVNRFRDHEIPVLLEWIAKALVNKGIALVALGRHEEALATNEEILRRLEGTDVPVLLEQVAIALLNKAATLGALGHPASALAACEEGLRRLEENDAPAFVEQLAKALVNKGVALAALNRPHEELAAYEDVLRRFGSSDAPALLEQVARALLYTGMTLGALDQPREEVAAYEEILRRFGDNEAPSLLEVVANALANKGAVLCTIDRPADALATCEDVMRRFGGSDAPAFLEAVAKALVNKGVALGELNRPEEALDAWERVRYQFGESDVLELCGSVVEALVNKGAVLSAIHRPDEALAACEDALQRFRASDAAVLLRPVAKALTNTLMKVSTETGPAHVRAVIKASPAAGFLLPLTTALEQEMGLAPRVAREVEEVAKDIRRKLATLKDRA